ncbi:hypothetical protein [Pendulispora albinea]|uniref:DUF4275 family protein n=1 Tax=Pendulispora albinea TaxID=2741071 RepID=A0ABZ2MB77_9BACT
MSITGMHREDLVAGLESWLRDLHGTPIQLEQRELWKVHKAWRERFTPTRIADRRVRAPDLWITLASGEDAAEREFAAVSAYEQRRGDAFIVILGYEELGFRCTGADIPKYDEIRDLMDHWKISDIYIIAPSFEWTFVVTNEQDAYGGPFFVVAVMDDPDVGDMG